MRNVRFAWGIVAFVLVSDIALGGFIRNNGTADQWIFKVGLLGASVAPVIFVIIYTVFGFTGRGKWWKNIMGTSLVWAALSVLPVTVPLAVAFWFYHGSLQPDWLGWSEVSGAPLTFLAWARLCAVWLYIHLSHHDGQPITPPDRELARIQEDVRHASL